MLNCYSTFPQQPETSKKLVFEVDDKNFLHIFLAKETYDETNFALDTLIREVAEEEGIPFSANKIGLRRGQYFLSQEEIRGFIDKLSDKGKYSYDRASLEKVFHKIYLSPSFSPSR